MAIQGHTIEKKMVNWCNGMLSSSNKKQDCALSFCTENTGTEYSHLEYLNQSHQDLSCNRSRPQDSSNRQAQKEKRNADGVHPRATLTDQKRKEGLQRCIIWIPCRSIYTQNTSEPAHPNICMNTMQWVTAYDHRISYCIYIMMHMTLRNVQSSAMHLFR